MLNPHKDFHTFWTPAQIILNERCPQLSIPEQSEIINKLEIVEITQGFPYFFQIRLNQFCLHERIPEHAEIIDKSDNDVSIDTQTSVVTGGHKEKRRGIHVVDANESESSNKDRENDNNKRVHSSGLNGKPEASHIDSDSPRAAHISLSKRRRRLIDIFQFSKYNVLDAARRELWDEIEEIREDATEDRDASTGETEACIDESVRIGDESMRKRYRWCEEAWKQLFEELVRTSIEAFQQIKRLSPYMYLLFIAQYKGNRLTFVPSNNY